MAAGAPQPHIPDYELLRKIGTGSYGDVWLARGITGAFRAVKIVWRDRFEDLHPYEREFEGITRFAAISLREPSQLALLHAGRNDAEGFFYYVMELADDAEHGRAIDPETYVPCTLKELFARRGRFPAEEVVSLGTGLARAVGTLHKAGLVHRDIKPSNVILVGGVPKLADVGLVAAVSGGALTFVGTEGFVPPEGPGAPSADVFSLGKLLYELATGLDRNEFPRLPDDFGHWPDRRALLELNEVLLRACEPDSRRRHEDGDALLEELLLLHAGKSVRRLRKVERRLGRAMRVGALLAVVAGVAGIGAWVERQRANAEAELRAQAEAERDELARLTIYAATLAQAQRALEHEDFGRARQLLATLAPTGGQEDLRGFEWRHLWHRAQGDPSTLIHAGKPIERIALSPDGRLLASHDSDEVVLLFDAGTFAAAGRVEGVTRLGGFDPTGMWLIGGTSRGISRWRVTDGTAQPAQAPGGVYLPIEVDGEGRLVAAVTGRPARIVVWDFEADRAAIEVPLGTPSDEPPIEFFRGALSPDGERALVACVIGRSANARFELFAVDLSRGEVTSLGAPPVRPGAVGWTTPTGGAIRWWIADDATGAWASAPDCSGPWAAEPEPQAAGVRNMISGHGISVTTAGSILSIEKIGSRFDLRGSEGTIADVSIRADGEFVFTGSGAGELRAWRTVAPTRGAKTFQGWQSPTLITGAEFSTDGQKLYVQEGETVVAELDAELLQPLRHIEGIRKVFAVTPDRLWGVSADGTAVVAFNLEDGRESLRLGDGGEPIVHAAFSGDGRIIAFTRSNGDLCSAKLDGRVASEVHSVAGLHHNYWAIRLNERGDRYWCATIDRKVMCRSLPKGEVVWSQLLPTVASDLIRLPSHRQIAVALESGEIQLHDESTGALVTRLPSGSSPPEGLAASHDGTRLHALTVAGDVQIYLLPRGFLLSTIPTSFGNQSHQIAISLDDDRLAIANKRGVVKYLSSR